ncbi:Beta-lactamase [Aquicella siphonis]|uniref:Beta-lactamase n=1 Tax=Aquicella siphonis TaxID=254247 RepID=A0A5E4PG73_9COXI|nr:serine hydrolase domain-containing protein [Aquicella siphonis]VVC75447.1 Beta-lactamase [Aquicella siphonis]
MQSRPEVVDAEQVLKTMGEADIPGVAIAFVDDQGTIATQELGVTKKDSADLVTSATIFGAASLSKPVFSYLILKMAQEGILDLKQPLNEILSFEHFCDQFCQEYNCQWEKTADDLKRAQSLSAKMILSHTTGFDLFKGRIDSRFDPGMEYRYSGLPLLYLQKVIEKLTGATLEDLAKKYVFEPLEMKHSSFYPGFDLSSMSEEGREPGRIYLKAAKHGLVYEVLTEDSNTPWHNMIPWHQLPRDFPRNISEIIQSKDKWLSTILVHVSKTHDIPPASAPNSLFTTAEDYARFVIAWMNDEELQYAFEPIIPMTKDEWAKGVNIRSENLENLACGMGFELEVNGEGKKPLAYKTGDMNQWRAQVAIDLENKTAIVYFSNAKNGHILASQIITPYVKLEYALDYFSNKYGFAIKIEPDWQKKEKARFEQIGKYLDSQSVSSHLQRMITNRNIPGVSVAIKQNNSIESYSAGTIDASNMQPVTNQTIFEAASLSKTVFAYIVLKQIEKGLLSKPGKSPESGLDRPLHEICDFGPPHMRDDPSYKLLTARLLLSHQSGLPNEFGSYGEKYAAAAGTRFDYSGEAYRFLNEVIEHVTGMTLHDLSQVIFNSDELGMRNSSFIPYPESSPQRQMRAIGHDSNGKKDETDHFPRQFPPHPAASLITTAEDYLKFLRVCAEDPFIIKHMFEEQIHLAGKDQKAIDADVPSSVLDSLGWGLGIGLQQTDQGTIAFHWGDVNTNRSFCAINLKTGNAVVCLTNSANGPSIFKQVAESVVGDLSPALNWLKGRGENKPVILNEARQAISHPSITSKSIFSHSHESIRVDKQEGEKIAVLRKRGG